MAKVESMRGRRGCCPGGPRAILSIDEEKRTGKLTWKGIDRPDVYPMGPVGSHKARQNSAACCPCV